MSSLKRKADSAPTKEREVKKSKSHKSKKAEAPSRTHQEKDVKSSKKTPLPPASSPSVAAAAEGESFRRGGADLLTPLERKQIRAQVNQDVLFEEENGEQSEDMLDSDGETVGKKLAGTQSIKMKNKKTRKEGFEGIKSKTGKSAKIDGLSYKRIHKGLVVLGCVTRIGKRDIALALPNNLTGFVPIASVSAGIRQQLAEQDDESSEEDERTSKKRILIDLSKFVKLGQYLRAVVTSVSDGTKKHIQLSTMPREANVGIDSESLVKHLIVQAEVASIEDHGAIVNLDIVSANTQAFIPSAELGDRKLAELEIGTPILCSVIESTSKAKVVKLSANSRQLDGHNSLKTVSDIKSLLPGTVVEFIVSESDEFGMRGTMMDLVDVTADVVHSGETVRGKSNSLRGTVGKKKKGRIVFSSMKDGHHQLGVSVLPHIVSLSAPISPDLDSGASATDVLPISTILDDITVVGVDPLRGLLLDIGIKNIAGFAHISRISNKRVKELSAASGTWAIGTRHKGRIVGYNPMDAQFLVSLEESVLQLPFLSYEDARPGQIISGKVTKYKSNDGEIRGIILKITESTSGMIPANHLADIQLQYPERKFKIDSVVQARVLSVDPDRRRLTLTCKKTLLNSKAAVWASYSDVQVGASSPGSIVAFLPSGALVEFYNHLKGFLPISEMSESFIRDPKEHFRVGQVINLRALTVDASQKRLVVSCRQDSEGAETAQQFLETLSVGTAVSAKVSEKLPEEFVVDIENTGIKAILPISHLVDGSDQKCAHAAKRIRVDQLLEDLVIISINKKKRYMRLTKKASLAEAFKSGRMPSSLDALAKDHEVTGFVKNITDAGVFVQFANNLTGLIPKSQLEETSSTLPDFGLRKNQSITSQVLSIDLDQQRFFLTQKARQPDVDDKFLSSAKDAASAVNPVDGVSTGFTLGQLTKVRVASVKDTQLNVKLADNVQGRIDISQIFDNWDKIKHKKHPLKTFQNNQIINVRIIGIHDAKTHRFLPITRQHGRPVFELTARPSDQTEEAKSRLSLADMKNGDSHLCFVNNVQSDHLWVNINTEIRGRINLMELTDDPKELGNLSQSYPVGSALQARVVQVNAAENRLDLSARPIDKARPQTLEDLSVGQAVVGKVSKILDKLVVVQISEAISGAIHICDLEDNFSKANPKALRAGQVVSAVVLSISTERKEIWLSKRPSKMSVATSAVEDSELAGIQALNVNDIRRGFISNITDQGLFISLSRDLTAFVRVSELFDQFVKNWKDKFSLYQLVQGKVIAVREAANQIQMSLKRSVLDTDFTPPFTFEDVEVGQIHTGQVRKVEDFGVFVVLDKSQNVSGLCHRSEIADGPVASVQNLYKEGDVVKVKILKVDNDKKRINLGMKASYIDIQDEEDGSNVEDDDDASEDSEGVGLDLSPEMVSHDNSGIEVPTTTGQSNDLNKQIRSNGTKRKDFGGLDLGDFDWTGGIAEAENDDIEMMDMDDAPEKTAKKRHGASLTQIDRTGDLDTQGAQSVSDFERLLMGQPNSSYLWLSYMAFHLQLSEVEKARQIAERALRTINRESTATEDEVLNVWIGLLNLENSYGSEESIDDVFRRACTYSEPKEVYTRLTSIYIQSGKKDKANTLFEEMVKKFSSDPKIWQNYASFLFDVAEDASKARALLPRAMQALPSHTHIDIATKFAHVEFKSAQGDNERGRTIFEGLITNFPKRLDLWNVLLDLEIKSGSTEQVRQLFDRVTAGKIKPQKAKFFFKKWLDYEMKHGDAKSQEKVKAKAAEFVRKHEEAKA